MQRRLQQRDGQVVKWRCFRRQPFDQIDNSSSVTARNSDSVTEVGARHSLGSDGLVVHSRVSISSLIRSSFLMKKWLNCVQSRLSA